MYLQLCYAGCINSFKDLNQQKTSIFSSPISRSPKSAVKLLLCFMQRIENNKTKKIETKANTFNKCAIASDCISECIGTSIQMHFK